MRAACVIHLGGTLCSRTADEVVCITSALSYSQKYSGWERPYPPRPISHSSLDTPPCQQHPMPHTAVMYTSTPQEPASERRITTAVVTTVITTEDDKRRQKTNKESASRLFSCLPPSLAPCTTHDKTLVHLQRRFSNTLVLRIVSGQTAS